jgi:hypothetical protein
MAKDIKGKTVKAGRLADLQEVKNQGRAGRAATKYNHVRVQLPDGREVSLLFTDSEVIRAHNRAKKNPEDLPTVSWLRNLFD